MLTGTLTCRILYVYYGAMAYMWMFKPADMLRNFDFISAGDATTFNLGGWCGASMATIAALFMDDGHWRNILAFDWRLYSVSGPDTIAEKLCSAQTNANSHGSVW